MHDTIKSIFDKYYLNKYCYSKNNDPIQNVFIQNDKYLRISENKKCFWNFLDLLKIDFRVDEAKVYIIKNNSEYRGFLEGSRILSINNNTNVLYELISQKDFYDIVIENKNMSRKTIRIKNPIIRENQINNKIKLYENDLFVKFNDLNNISYINNFLNQIDIIDLFILDLRDNQGGSFTNAIRFLEYFIQKGHIITYLEDKNNEYKVTSKQNKKINFENLVIFFNNFTISSAEVIIKSLITEFPNSILIGEKSGGKDIVTNIFSCEEYFIKIPQYKYKFNNYLDKSPIIKPNFDFRNIKIKKRLKELGLISEKFD
ncbi:S41 family peptidase [Lysinibacillus sp. FSL K6-1151]|uniref:S41 family peptidase n=1 Tax=Lysinibacillus sp. FSL K6-1151 TaxID=2921465 RepID=UPI003159F8E7